MKVDEMKDVMYPLDLEIARFIIADCGHMYDPEHFFQYYWCKSAKELVHMYDRMERA